MNNIKRTIIALLLVAGVMLVPATVSAQVNSNVTQTINTGTLTTAILDGSRNVVASPSAAMTAANFSFNCQAVTGTLGSASQRLYVINPSGTTAGQTWTLTLAATGNWENTGATRSYSYNDPTVAEATAGCANGQLTVNPSAGTVTTDCASTACTTAVITKGGSTAMSGVTPVTILTSAVGTTVWRGYITNIGLSQQIPAEQPADSYTLPMTLTVTAA